MDDRWISPEQAERLWRRAAELQAEAAQRLEERSRSAEAGGEGDDEAGGPPPDGYAMEHVRQAAVEAGIGEEFLHRALAEMEAGGSPGSRDASDRLADLFLGDGPREMVISRTFEAPVERVYGILQELLPSQAYPLRLVDTRGPHPVEGGVLLFEVPKVDYTALDFSYEVRGWADIKQVLLSLERMGDERTVVTLRAPLDHSRRVNLWIGGGLSGTVSATMGAVAGASAAAVVSPWVAPLMVILVGLMTAGGTFAGVGWSLTHLWRLLYRYALGRGRKALEDILQDVHVRLRLEGRAMPPGDSPPLPPPPSSDSSSPSSDSSRTTSG